MMEISSEEISDTSIENETSSNESKEHLDIFVKPELDVKPETILGITDSDLNKILPNVPLHIRAREEKRRIKIKCSLCPALFDAIYSKSAGISLPHTFKKHFSAIHEAKNVEPKHEMGNLGNDPLNTKGMVIQVVEHQN